MHKQITAPVHYLPEYLHDEPRPRAAWRLERAAAAGVLRLRPVFLRDLARDPTRNRLRRLGQACVMARELPASIRHLHVHYLHTPASVIRYAALLRGLSWSFSAHAKDIWTTPDWEKREKIAAAAWGVTCTRDGHARAGAAQPAGPTRSRWSITGSISPAFRHRRRGWGAMAAIPADPVRFVTIGRAVEKKGFDDLLEALASGFPHAALAADPYRRRREAEGLAGAGRGAWAVRTHHLGRAEGAGRGRSPPCARPISSCCRPKQAGDGDRDGLPNVVMEAASQALPIVATDFAGIPEFVRDGVEGLLVAPGDVAALAQALANSPPRRSAVRRAGCCRASRG
jgi:glycosyltransferase involved in cell wall biosynthesis